MFWNGSFFRALLALTIAFVLPSCERSPRLAFEHAGPTMGSTYSIKIPNLPKGVSAPEVLAGVERRLAEIDEQMSTYRPDSSLARFNASSSADWVDVPAGLADLLSTALKVSEMTGGAFDVTVGPLVRLWGFGPGGEPARIPPGDELTKVADRIGYGHLAVRPTPPALRKDRPDVDIDVNAIAPGYAADRIVDFIASLGIEDYLVEVGGEVRARGRNHRGVPWRIGIERPQELGRSVQTGIEIGDMAVATSGDYRKFFEKDGRKYSHTIDPFTLRPVEHGLASVTVLHPSAAMADALATGLSVLGPDRGFAFAEEHGLPAYFLVHAGEGFRELATSAFAPYRLE